MCNVALVLRAAFLLSCVFLLAGWDWPWAFTRPDVKILGTWSDENGDREEFLRNGTAVLQGQLEDGVCRYEFVDQAVIVLEHCRGAGTATANKLFGVGIEDGRLSLEDQRGRVFVFHKQ